MLLENLPSHFLDHVKEKIHCNGLIRCYCNTMKTICRAGSIAQWLRTSRVAHMTCNLSPPQACTDSSGFVYTLTQAYT